jgi:hypothetical protein
MCGDRDSEIAVVIKDSKTVASKMNGEDYMASSFAYDLRIKLWMEHLGKNKYLAGKLILGLDESQIDLVQDPVVQFEYWQKISSQNTWLLEEVFPYFPRNSITRLSDVGEAYVDSYNVEKLEQVQGHLTDYPLEFLAEESLTPIAVSSLILDTTIFQ